MTDKQKLVLEEACLALENNPQKATDAMRDGVGGRCCLAVMEEVGMKYGLPEGNDRYPAYEFVDFFGLTVDPKNRASFLLDGHSADKHNDGYGTEENVAEKTHKEIAALIRKEYLSDSK